MLRISKLTDYATVLLARLAREPAVRLTAGQLADSTRLGPPTVSKLLKLLQRHGLLTSTRGLRGGYQLARSAEQISAADILDAVEGPMALTECAGDANHCGIEHHCPAGQAWKRVNRAIRNSLQGISLLELAGLRPVAGSDSRALPAQPVTLGSVAVRFNRRNSP